MSAGERVSGLVEAPIVGAAKGISSSHPIGAIAGGTVAGAIGTVSGGIYGTIAGIVPAAAMAVGGAAVAAVVTAIGAAIHVGAAALATSAGWAVVGHAVATAALIGGGVLGGGTLLACAAAGALGIGLVGAAVGGMMPSAFSGLTGLVGGVFKGIKNLFAGSPATVPENEQQLMALREQAISEQARTEAYMRQRERAAAIETVSNLDARDDNLIKLQQSKQQQVQLASNSASI